MKKDLAPKSYFVLSILTCLVGIAITYFIHQKSMNLILNEGENKQFLITTIIGTCFLFLPIVILNKIRYVVNEPDSSIFKVGNIISDRSIGISEIFIERRIIIYIYKVNIEDKYYYVFTNNDMIERFNRIKSTAHNRVDGPATGR